MTGEVFLGMLRRTGFTAVEQVAGTGHDSSPETFGALVRAVRPAAS